MALKCSLGCILRHPWNCMCIATIILRSYVDKAGAIWKKPRLNQTVSEPNNSLPLKVDDPLPYPHETHSHRLGEANLGIFRDTLWGTLNHWNSRKLACEKVESFLLFQCSKVKHQSQHREAWVSGVGHTAGSRGREEQDLPLGNNKPLDWFSRTASWD